MRELLTVQDGGQGDKNASDSRAALVNGLPGSNEKSEDDNSPLPEEEVESIRQRTAAYLLGEGRWDGENKINERSFKTGMGSGIPTPFSRIVVCSRVLIRCV